MTEITKSNPLQLQAHTWWTASSERWREDLSAESHRRLLYIDRHEKLSAPALLDNNDCSGEKKVSLNKQCWHLAAVQCLRLECNGG